MKTNIKAVIIWFISTLFVVYAFCLNTAAAVFAEAIKTTLHASHMGVSLATGSFIAGFALMQIPAGYLLDRYNARYMVSLGIFLLALGNIFISLTNSLWLFSLLNCLQGIGASFSFIAAAVLIGQWFSQASFPVLFGLTQTISCITAGIAHYYLTIALDIYTWNEVYQGLSMFGACLLVLSLLFVSSTSKATHADKMSLRASLKQVLSNIQIWLCSAAAAMSFGIVLSYASFWYMPVQDFFQVSTLESVIISGIIFLGIGVGTPFIGWLSNLAKTRKMLIHVTVTAGAMALIAGLYLPHFEFNSLLLIKIISFLIGFLLSGAMLYYTIVNEISTDETRGVAISVLNTAVFVFNTLMLFIPYLLKLHSSQHFFTYLWVLPFFVMFSILILYFIKDSQPD